MRKIVNFRSNKLSQALIKHIEDQTDKGKSQTTVIIELLEAGLTSKTKHAALEQRIGESIDTHQTVFRKSPILIPCPNTNRWVDMKLDCNSGCKLKCRLTQDQKALIKGLMLYSQASTR